MPKVEAVAMYRKQKSIFCAAQLITWRSTRAEPKMPERFTYQMRFVIKLIEYT